MGASILVHWPGATEDQQEGHMGFFNDDRAWANWLTNVLGDDAARAEIGRLGLASVLSNTTDGMADEDISWTTPAELERAAEAFRALVIAASPLVSRSVSVDASEATGASPERVRDDFARDLADVAAIARYAAREGAKSVTLGYYW